jgi:hypothetical protein
MNGVDGDSRKVAPCLPLRLSTGALVASVVILASSPTPQVQSATADYALTRTSSSSTNAVATTQQMAEDYTSTLEKFEPWALEQDEAAGVAAPSYSMLDHMRGAPVVDAE